MTLERFRSLGMAGPQDGIRRRDGIGAERALREEAAERQRFEIVTKSVDLVAGASVVTEFEVSHALGSAPRWAKPIVSSPDADPNELTAPVLRESGATSLTFAIGSSLAADATLDVIILIAL